MFKSFPGYKRIIFLFFVSYAHVFSSGQEPEQVIKAFFDNALTGREAMYNLEYLCRQTPGRLPGSEASLRAVMFAAEALKKAGADSVWLQEITVPKWQRGKESCSVISSRAGSVELSISALGLSVPSPPGGITAEVVEVKDFEQLGRLGKEKINGKVVFFSQPADNRIINTFTGYAGVVIFRINGAAEAAKYGASAVIVRSATQATHDFPHTGVTRYQENIAPIPAVAVSPFGADRLSEMLRKDPHLKVRLVTECRSYPDTVSWNVIGELRGTLHPDEFITVGGHLDSWDITEGAHDDAGGCVQAIEMIRLLKSAGIRTKRTVRAVMFMNEEISGTGGITYAREAQKKGEKHYAALESDRGVMSPRGFGFDTDGERLKKLSELSRYFQPYNIRDFDKGGGGSDIGPLKPSGTLLIGYMPDTQRYFDYHHSANDTFEKVNIRELQLGSAAITSLIYLIDLFDL